MFEILEHSADEKFHAEGESKEEAFSEAVKAFAEIVGGDTHGQYHHKIEVESENLEALLYDFLDELVFLQDSETVVISYAEELEVEEKRDSWTIKATIVVDNITSDMSLLDIKSPTYNEMKVDYQDKKWILEAVLDV
ncbi:MAG: archease [Candidatus Nanohaloarchaea archaeon]